MRPYYFTIHGNFTETLLVDFYNIVNHTDEKIIITISSPGGELSVLYSILYIINSNPDRFEILINEVVESCALYLVLMADCEVHLLESASCATYHNAFFVGVDTNKWDDKDDEFMIIRKRELTRLNKRNANYLSLLGVDEEKLARISKGKDVAFSRKEILTLIKNKRANDIKYGLNLDR
jgi:ATP-dependent protease ClpP protease subunit